MRAFSTSVAIAGQCACFRLRESRFSNAAHLRAALKKEKTMKLITRYELANRPTSELRGLLRQTFDAMAQSAPESAERRDALASLENIRAELGVRPDGP
jgi:hypothetical protein